MRPCAEDAVREAGLIAKARAGEAAAFSVLVRLHEDRAVRVAYAFTRNWEDARDIAQEAFVKAYENLAKFRSRSLFSSWLYRIIANLAKDSFRKKKVREGVNVASPWNEEMEEGDPVKRVVSNAPDALRETMNHELGENIQASIETLPLRQKNVFVLRYLQGLSLEEIARVLDLSVGAVKAHLWQAGQKMQKQLTVYLTGGRA